ncbi:PqqD family protein [Ramlibacter albus]|uniref:PqqD family protein n=1 Tax=Ramlibacter albus TaxID=2079448 RepID=A0A923MA46_9BURK|nr:PqqD family protein [Ramlibacter albus]MBC5765302.1 PqqD family protein [Ramlibacter albus]
MLSETTCLKATEGVLTTNLSGELVLLQAESGNYYGLDTIGTQAWDLLTVQGLTVQAAARAIATEFGVDVERVRRDLEELAQALLSAGLVAVAHS